MVSFQCIILRKSPNVVSQFQFVLKNDFLECSGMER